MKHYRICITLRSYSAPSFWGLLHWFGLTDPHGGWSTQVLFITSAKFSTACDFTALKLPRPSGKQSARKKVDNIFHSSIYFSDEYSLYQTQRGTRSCSDWPQFSHAELQMSPVAPPLLQNWLHPLKEFPQCTTLMSSTNLTLRFQIPHPIISPQAPRTLMWEFSFSRLVTIILTI